MTIGNEADVAVYLTMDGQVFLAPQYNVVFESEHGEGGACADFVALDWRRKHVVIVEVTTAADLEASLIGRIRERETRWYNPVRRTLKKLSAIDDTWRVRFLGFVRAANLPRARSACGGSPDVTFHSIEDATFPWLYWDERMKSGLPGGEVPLP
jgi:hypothetical protein